MEGENQLTFSLLLDWGMVDLKVKKKKNGKGKLRENHAKGHDS